MKSIFSEKFFRKIGLITVTSVFFLIFIGGLVRITGSGMGCPDWPKCFGYFIPPTSEKQVTFQPNHTYQKGQMIIQDGKLMVAQSTFTTADTYEANAASWQKYPKHDYAEFDAVHTYIEYVNRLVGALTGLFILLTMISSFRYWNTKRSVTVLSIISFILVCFQGWLGAKVVDSELQGIKISVHYLAAFAVIALVMITVYKDRAAKGISHVKSIGMLKYLLVGTMAVTLLQIVMGTQVREGVDNIKDAFAGNGWADALGSTFVNHKTLSALVLLMMGGAYFMVNRKVYSSNPVYKYIAAGFVLTVLQIATGSMNVFFNLPKAVQLMHVTIAALLIGSQFYVSILLFNYKKEQNEERHGHNVVSA